MSHKMIGFMKGEILQKDIFNNNKYKRLWSDTLGTFLTLNVLYYIRKYITEVVILASAHHLQRDLVMIKK